MANYATDHLDDWTATPKPQEPKCLLCGGTMVERFAYEPVNAYMTLARPLGVFDCLHCQSASGTEAQP